MSRRSRVTYRQIGGDDGYCWCVLVDGRIKWDSMTRSEAKWRADNEKAALAGESPTRPSRRGEL